MIGTTLLDRYRIESPLGEGGMGAVYRGRDTRLERDVAVKVLRRDLLDDEGRERMLREARSAAALNHPNIVAVYDTGEAGGVPFVVMELVEGGSLRARGPVGLPEALDVARQLCDALAHAHAHGIVHRDLKPENVLLTRDATVKVADLGLARSAGGSGVTRSGVFLGTPSYIAPEQALGSAVDGRADLYALGVMLYEMAASRLPFPGDDALAVVSQHLYAPVVPPSTYRPGLPPPFDAVILKLMAKLPDDRFASAADVREALQGLAPTVAATPPAPVSAPAAPALGQLVRGRLVGRSEELARLREVWTNADRGQGHMVLLSGEPGVGKTRLARELVVYARLHGAYVLQGGCYEFEATTPYLPFVEALRSWVHGRDPERLRTALGSTASELARLAPEIEAKLGAQPKNPELSPTEERMRLFDNVVRFLLGLASDRGLLLMLDDLHWADHGTLAMLHYVVRQARESRIMILGAYREAELDRAHPLQKSLVEWNRERLATRVALGRLGIESTASMLAVMFGQDDVAPDFARALFQETEGNPFFVEEVVKALIEQGQIYREGGEWQRQGVDELAIPQSIKAAVSRRLDRLSPGCTEVLQTAAALGKTFEFGELAAVATVAEDPLLDALDEAAASQLIRSEGGERFMFTHDKIREVLHQELNPIRQRRLHQRIGESLERLHGDDLDAHVADLAFHFAESGDLRKGLDYSLRAGEQAEKLYVHEDALRSYERARECAEALEDLDTLGRVEEKLGDVFGEIGDTGPAAKHYERALALARVIDRQASVECKIGELYARLADPRGVPILEKALQNIDPERNPADMARAMATLGRFHHHHGKHTLAAEHHRKAFALAEKAGNRELTSLALGYLAGAYQHLTQLEESDRYARQVIEYGEKNDYKSAISMGHEFLAENASCRGDWDATVHHAMLDREWGEKTQSQERIVWSRFTAAWGWHGKGDLAKARLEAEAGLTDAERIGEKRVGRFLKIKLVEVLLDQGEERQAWELGNEVTAESAASGMVLHRSEAHRLKGWLHAYRGEWAEAQAECEAAMGVVAGTEQRIAPLLAAWLLAEARVRTGHPEAPAAIADAIERAKVPKSVYYEALGRRANALLLASKGDPEAQREFDEVVAMLERTHSPIEVAVTRIERGLHEAARGDVDAAREDLTKARDLAEKCGAKTIAARAAKALSSLASSSASASSPRP
jgi:eukaryotic-like serine/threonine-protein kinase